MNLEHQALLSFYQELSPLAGNPRVLLVRHVETGTFYVKKILPLENKEIYTLLQSHPVPGIPGIVLVVETEDQLIVIEEYINGSSLDLYLQQNGILSEQNAVSIALQLCRILDSLHHLDPPVIHRDIKPSNVIITSDRNVWLIDFDAARTHVASQLRDTTMLGTAEFAAPEQYGFAQSDARTDLFSLGILLNIMLTGHFPYQVTAKGPAGRIIRTCTQIDPANRYDSAASMAKALQKLYPESSAHSRAFPGFRSGTLWKMILAILGYASILWLSATLEVEHATLPFTVICCRIITLLILLSWVLIFSNYRNVCHHLLLARSRHLPVSLIGRLLWCLLVMVTFLILMGLITTPFDPGFAQNS